MKMFKSHLLLLIALTCSWSVSAQRNYQTALGARIGGTSGFTIKHFYKPSSAVEGIVGFFGNGFSLTGLVEKHQKAFDVKELSFYYGAGAHLAIYNNRNRYYDRLWRDVNYDYQTDVGIGINGLLGLEYTFTEIPLAISLDLKPFIEIGSGGYVGFSPDPSFGVKFTF